MRTKGIETDLDVLISSVYLVDIADDAFSVVAKRHPEIAK